MRLQMAEVLCKIVLTFDQALLGFLSRGCNCIEIEGFYTEDKKCSTCVNIEQMKQFEKELKVSYAKNKFKAIG